MKRQCFICTDAMTEMVNQCPDIREPEQKNIICRDFHIYSGEENEVKDDI